MGEPVAVLAAPAALLDDAAAEAAELGAVRVLTAAVDPDLLTGPVVDALAAAVAAESPDLVLVSNAIESRDAAAAFAVRLASPSRPTSSASARDELGVVAHHAAFGGAFAVEGAPTFGPSSRPCAPGRSTRASTRDRSRCTACR